LVRRRTAHRNHRAWDESTGKVPDRTAERSSRW